MGGQRPQVGFTSQSEMRKALSFCLAATTLFAHSYAQVPANQEAATDRPLGTLETVATFPGPMPEGVTVSHTGRIFVNFARWGDDIPFTVAELINGKAVAYPNEAINDWPGRKLPNPNAFTDASVDQTHFVSVQSVVVDPDDRLWVLDTGAPKLKNIVPDGPKLVAIDLHTNKVVKTILITSEACGTNCYLNDVRFDLRVGDTGSQDASTMVGSHPALDPNKPAADPEHPNAARAFGTPDAHGVVDLPVRDRSMNPMHGTAYITDSSSEGPNAIIVVDLATGKSWRRLNQHSSVLSEDQFLMFAEGRPVYMTEPNKPPKAVNFAADGIALSNDGETLYYCPINGTKLYAVATAMLRDRTKSDAQVAGTVRIVTGKMPSDGMESDATGNVYMTDPVTDSIHRWNSKTGLTETIAHDPRILWPDTMSLAGDGYLYFTSNQLHEQPTMHNGQDLRRKPYQLFRIKVDAQPVQLK